jgi:RNA polymerase sigma factor (sigma-70 family)
MSRGMITTSSRTARCRPRRVFSIQRQDDDVTPTTKTARSMVFVVDDDPSVREAITRLLGTVGLPVTEFGSALDFLAGDRPEAPSCLVLDVRLPGISGIDFQRELSKANICIPIIFITAHGDVPMSVKAMKAGAVEFLIKPFHDQDLLDAVQTAIEKDRLRRLREAEIAELQQRLSTLTPREREVLPLVISGLLNKQIAAEINASEATVKVHRSQLMRKLEAKSVPDLVRMAEKMGIRAATPKPDPSLPK